MPELLKPQELAERLKVHERTIRIWSQKGWIPFYRLGGQYRYVFEEVFAALYHPASKPVDAYVRIRREEVPA